MKLHFDVRPEIFAIARLDAGAALPQWAMRGQFCSITRTDQELSILCEESSIPDGITATGGWRWLALRGPFAFTETGIAAAFTAVLATAGIGVLVVSSYDTDAVLVAGAHLDRAVGALVAAGHAVSGAH
jgi:hypothetical protein